MADTETSITPRAIIVARFEGVHGGHEALKSFEGQFKQQGLDISDCAVLRKDEKGRIRISETSDWSGRKGMAVGGIAGGALGVMTGGVGWLVLGGAAIVGLASRLRDTGFDNEQLRLITEHLDP